MDIPIPKKRVGSFLSSLSSTPGKTEISGKTEKLDKTKSVRCKFQVVAGANSETNIYRRVISRFQEGTPAQYIVFLDSLYEIWDQNSITRPDHRIVVVRSLLQDASQIVYDNAILELQKPDKCGKILPFDVDLIFLALDTAIGSGIICHFPRQALQIQKTGTTKEFGTKDQATGLSKQADPDKFSKTVKGNQNSGLKTKKAKTIAVQPLYIDGAKKYYYTYYGKNPTHQKGGISTLLAPAKRKAEVLKNKPSIKKGKPFHE